MPCLLQYLKGAEMVWHGEAQVIGGGGGIRTPGTLSSTPVFKTGAINHSATPPRGVLPTRANALREREVEAQ